MTLKEFLLCLLLLVLSILVFGLRYLHAKHHVERNRERRKNVPEKSIYSEYLHAQNAMDDIYSAYQKKTGLTDAEFWCIFSIYNGECTYQYEISRHMFMNKQTVNTALKQLVQKGLIQMVNLQEDRRYRKISLTNCGKEFARKYLDNMDKAGEKAWASLSDKEQTVLVNGTKKFNTILSNELKAE